MGLDQTLYGSSRIGQEQIGEIIASSDLNLVNINTATQNIIGDRYFEMSNHLGNVLEVVSDRKLPVNDGNGNIDYFLADVVSYSDYYPGGMVMPGRSGNANSYKYGFNGMLKDDEIKGEGNSYDFGARMYDPRVMRWLSLDPAARDYPSMSDYSAMGNNPILYIDPDGERIYIYYTSKDENGKTINKAYEYGSGLKLPNDKFVRKAVRTLKKLEKRGKDPYGIINNLSNDKDEHIAIVQKETWNSSAVIFEFGNVVFEDNTLTKDDFVIPPDEIHWNTRSGLISPDGKKKTSSGMGLLHEIGHKYFYMFINGTEEDKTGRSEEHRV